MTESIYGTLATKRYVTNNLVNSVLSNIRLIYVLLKRQHRISKPVNSNKQFEVNLDSQSILERYSKALFHYDTNIRYQLQC